MKNVRTNLLLVILVPFIGFLVYLFGSNRPGMSMLRYWVRGGLGLKYVYKLDHGEMKAAVITKGYNGVEEMAMIIRDGNDTFDLSMAGTGHFLSCEHKRQLIDTIRIKGVLFGIMKYSHGKGRNAATEYLFIPEIFLHDSLYGECIKSQPPGRK